MILDCEDPSKLVFGFTSIKSTGNQIFICKIADQLLTPEQMAATLLHELAHDFGVGDELQAERVRELISKHAEKKNPWIMEASKMENFAKNYLLEVIRYIKKDPKCQESQLDPTLFADRVRSAKAIFYDEKTKSYLIRSHPELDRSAANQSITSQGFTLK